MTHYRSNLRDVEFNVFEFLGLADYLGQPPFEEFDPETSRDILREVERLAREDFAASFEVADRTKLKLENGEVHLPEELKRSLDAYYDGGWDRLPLPKELGGMWAPQLLRWAVQEFLVGANPAAFFYISGGLMAAVIADVGTPEQVERFAKPMVERRWGATMVLTEPDAGSDVGAGTTKAVHVEGDVYHLEGVKRFITSGEHDYSENIIHLVLARPEGAPPGTKGLSMFIVPKYLVNEDGSLGERNGIFATRLEEKMGIKGSTTCELTLGVDRPCVGYLVGGVHDGIRQMFKVIEDARMLIGAKSMATLSTGYLNALEYAKERHQGADMTQMRDKTAPRVPIIRHPDVRRMLMLQKAYAEGMRALVMYAAWVLDQSQLEGDGERWERRHDFLLPLVKGYCSEKGYELLATSLQVLGGSGYTMDYPMEQYIRDAKIDTIYEGTTGIQALDLFFRKIARDQGRTVTELAEEILAMVKGGPEEFAAERELLGKALEHVQAHLGVMVGHLMASQQTPEEIYKVGFHTNALLESLGEVVIAWLLLRQGEVALAALEEGRGDTDFYTGKLAAVRYFVHDALPKAEIRRKAAEAETGSLMELTPDQF